MRIDEREDAPSVCSSTSLSSCSSPPRSCTTSLRASSRAASASLFSASAASSRARRLLTLDMICVHSTAIHQHSFPITNGALPHSNSIQERTSCFLIGDAAAEASPCCFIESANQSALTIPASVQENSGKGGGQLPRRWRSNEEHVPPNSSSSSLPLDKPLDEELGPSLDVKLGVAGLELGSDRSASAVLLSGAGESRPAKNEMSKLRRDLPRLSDPG